MHLLHTETKWNFEPKDSIRTRTFQILNWSSFLAPNHYFFFFIENYPCSLLWQSWFLALKNSTYDNFLKLSKKSIFTFKKKTFARKVIWSLIISAVLAALSSFSFPIEFFTRNERKSRLQFRTYLVNITESITASYCH